MSDILREKHLSLHMCSVKRTIAKSDQSDLSADLWSQAQALLSSVFLTTLPAQFKA